MNNIIIAYRNSFAYDGLGKRRTLAPLIYKPLYILFTVKIDTSFFEVSIVHISFSNN